VRARSPLGNTSFSTTPRHRGLIARYADVALTGWGPRRSVEPLGYADDHRGYRGHTLVLDGEALLHRAKPILACGETMFAREVAGLHNDYGGLSVRLDNLDRRVGRIEQRLELVEAPTST
jgi:hypothetical protein